MKEEENLQHILPQSHSQLIRWFSTSLGKLKESEENHHHKFLPPYLPTYQHLPPDILPFSLYQRRKHHVLLKLISLLNALEITSSVKDTNPNSFFLFSKIPFLTLYLIIQICYCFSILENNYSRLHSPCHLQSHIFATLYYKTPWKKFLFLLLLIPPGLADTHSTCDFIPVLHGNYSQ